MSADRHEDAALEGLHFQMRYEELYPWARQWKEALQRIAQEGGCSSDARAAYEALTDKPARGWNDFVR